MVLLERIGNGLCARIADLVALRNGARSECVSVKTCINNKVRQKVAWHKCRVAQKSKKKQKSVAKCRVAQKPPRIALIDW